MGSWMRECNDTHTKCHQLFGNDGPGRPVAAWFPDRLIRITRTEESGMVDISTRIVLKSDPADFPPAKAQAGVNYLSFSHCWGPPPNPSAPMGGRGGSVLTDTNLATWREMLPVDDLPPAFQHAVKICACLGFDHIWIDSLCILQDSAKDWEVQSAAMADVYKFAWLNIAALSTASDFEGFINDARDPRVVFGFRAPFASILGRSEGATSSRGRACVLLQGEAMLLWRYQSDLPGASSWSAPLFERAWVYQERSLARRMLAFTTHGVFFDCDEGGHGEHPDWPGGSSASRDARRLQQSILDMAAALQADTAVGNPPSTAHRREQAIDLMRRFDSTWTSSVTAYTSCQLTKSTDRLIAISAVARSWRTPRSCRSDTSLASGTSTSSSNWRGQR